MNKKRITLWWLLFAVIIIVSFYFDKEIVKFIASIRIPFLNDFFMGLTYGSTEIIIFFFLTSLFLWQEHKRKWILPLWFTLGLSAIVGFILKVSVHRLRPYQLGIVPTFSVLEEASHIVWDFSFPSFQSIMVFCAIPILSKKFPKFKYVWIVIASLVAFSRVYFGVHFLSDVLAGALIGYLIGWLIVKIEDKKSFGEKIYNKLFRR
jgi:undecaprenyl-diphosphatase